MLAMGTPAEAEDNLGCAVPPFLPETGSLSCSAAFARSSGSGASCFSCVYLSHPHRSARNINASATISNICMRSGDLNSGPLTYEGSVLFFPLHYLQQWFYASGRGDGEG